MEFSDFTTMQAVKEAAGADELTDREKHLIGIVVAVTRGCVMCSTAKLKDAVQSGIPQEVLIKAVDLAAQVNAGVTVATAIQGARRARLDDLDDAEECTSGACTLPK